tara:strand:+ start:3752 stop:4078 length:327 start_codon:yes stop_codon:yes gene_type:complete
LALANLITGIDSSSDLEWGRSHPVADFAGGYTAFQSVEGGVYRFGQYESGNGLWLRLMGSLSTNPAANSEVISPNLAYTVDRKYDNGMPWTGWIRATGWGAGYVRGGI